MQIGGDDEAHEGEHADRLPAPLTRALCWSHARRYFFELADIAKKARDGGSNPTADGNAVIDEAKPRTDNQSGPVA
mgnify:CR=1 FL=1